MFYAVAVSIWNKHATGENRWDRVESKHCKDFWAAYGSEWVPQAEIHEISKFVPADPIYTLERGFSRDSVWGSVLTQTKNFITEFVVNYKINIFMEGIGNWHG